MPAYATVAEFEAYVEGWVTDNADTLERELERGSRDVDNVLGPRPILTDGTFAGFKLDPTFLRPVDAQALSRATCAQTLHRIRSVDAQGTPRRRVRSVSGPDFSETYADSETAGTGAYAPALANELKPLRHLRALTARATR